MGGNNISQSDYEYSKWADYQIYIKSYSIVRASKLSILLYYPATVTPDPVYKSGLGCQIFQDGTQMIPRTNCKLSETSRMFNATALVDAGFTGNLSIKIKFKNPKDNWGIIGFKIKTFEREEIVASPALNPKGYNYYLADKLEGNELIPNLVCNKPCYRCIEDNGKVADKNYCTSCW